MSLGNTVEGLLGAYLINRYAGGRHALQTPQNSFRFAGLTALASLSISATCGALTLSFAGLGRWADYGAIWITWALGNFASYILVGSTVMMGSRSEISMVDRADRRGGRVLPRPAARRLRGVLRIPRGISRLPARAPWRTHSVVVRLPSRPPGRHDRRAPAHGARDLRHAERLRTVRRSTPTASIAMVLLDMNLTAIMALTLAALTSEYSVAEAQLRELVVTDPLTGLPNYRCLVEVLGTEITRANRTDRPFAVVFFDMDGLKSINDARPPDWQPGRVPVCRNPARVVPRDRHRRAAWRRRVRGRAAGHRRGRRQGGHPPDGRTPRGGHGQAGTVGSAGVAIYPRDGGTPTTLLSAADRALYVKADKAAARRRGVVAIRDWSNAASR